MQANELKNQGNKAFQAKDYDLAIDLFSQAIKLEPTNHVLWSNRSGAWVGKKQWTEALADAEEVCGGGLRNFERRKFTIASLTSDNTY